MTPDQWVRIEELYHAAGAQPAASRGEWLAAACGGDEIVRREVESLLAQHASSDDLLEDSALSHLSGSNEDGVSLIGQRAGSYEILSLIDEGGMGQVYRARDLTLPRDVAVKVIPPALAHDPARRARFRQEAELLASLSHPHVAHVYAFVEDGGRSLLVMELVPGQTLAERLARGALPLAEALTVARQISDALEAAHDQGVVHRDLKPANVKIMPDGSVKVLDFGLAAPLRRAASNGATRDTGSLLGTAGYLSPERARGESDDRRGDIWAFGCVLYEMITGRQTYSGTTVTEILTAIQEREPDWTALPAALPRGVLALLRRCLDKDPRRRLRDIGEARVALDDLIEGKHGPEPRRGTARTLVGAAAAIAVVAAGLVIWRAPQPAAARVVRMALPQPAGKVLTVSSAFDVSATPDLALTPDGSQLVYVGNNGSTLYVRSLDSLEPREVASGYQLRNPFVSPRGDWVGYADRRFVVKKVAITGGPSIPLPARLDTDLAGATWLPDDTVVFATFGEGRGLRRASAAAGTPGEENETLTRPDPEKGEVRHLWPEALPGGQAVLFTITYRTGGLGTAQVWVLDLRTRAQKPLVVGGSGARFVPAAAGATRGHLVYAAEGGLRAISFDAEGLTTSGTPVSVVTRLATSAYGAGDFTVASNGTLAYVDATDPGPATLAWLDRKGTEEPIAAPNRSYGWVRVAPDGTRLALGTSDPGFDVAVWDVRRAALTPLRFASTEFVNGPVWTADSRRIVVQARLPNHAATLWWAAADGSDTAEQLTAGSNTQRPTGVSPDGTHVILMEARGSLDVMQVALDRTRQVSPLIKEPSSFDAGGVVSPDGRWLAYESDVSGRLQIHVCPYPDVSGPCTQVSTMGGTAPRWLPKTGAELFFASLDNVLMSVAVAATGRTWQAGAPARVVDLKTSVGTVGSGSAYGTYDVASDGRIVVIKRPAASPDVALVLNWSQELARLAQAR